MKRMLLFIAAGLMMITTAQATEIGLNESSDFIKKDRRYRNAQPVLFTYNNVDYAIFPDGHIEFELPDRYTRTRVNRRSGNRYNRFHVNNRRSFVRYNRYGQVTKIGNTRIFYNGYGNVAKVGALRVNYNRGVVNQVGGLQVLYNRRGRLLAARGHVLVRNFYGHGHDCSTHDFGHFGDDHHDDNRDWDDGVYFKRKAK